MKTLLIILGVLLIAGGVYGYFNYSDNPYEQQACTMEAMICPDGTAVGRTGPNCEFAACPTPQGGRSAEINSFITCKVAGYPIMESYPERCRTPEGLTFVNYESCIQVIGVGRDPESGEQRTFPTPCDIPEGWEKM